MKSAILLYTMFAALAASVSARAADTAELQVKGTIRPAACILTLGAGGTVDYGYITNAQLSASAATVLPRKTVSLTINCPNGAAKVGVTLTDNRKDSVVSGIVRNMNFNGASPSDYQAFGLGTVNGKKLGAYVVQIDAVTKDPQSGASAGGYAVTRSFNGGTTWHMPQVTVPSFFDAGEIKAWSTNTASPSPSAVTSVNTTLTVQAVLEKIGNLPTGNNIPLDGSATLEMRYF